MAEGQFHGRPIGEIVVHQPAHRSGVHHLESRLDAELFASGDHRVRVYTNGTGMVVNVRIDGEPCPGWEGRDAPVEQTVALGVARKALR